MEIYSLQPPECLCARQLVSLGGEKHGAAKSGGGDRGAGTPRLSCRLTLLADATPHKKEVRPLNIESRF